MSILNRILNPAGREAGWSAVDASHEGLFGVTVLAPREPGGKPVVAGCGAVAGGSMDAESLARLARAVSAPGCPWTVPLNRKTYNILVIAEPAVQPAEMDGSVRWAISTLVDYPLDQADVAWMKIPTATLQPNRPPHLYVVSTRHEIVAAHAEAFKQARLNLQAVDVRETAHRNLAALAAKPGEGVALLSMGKQGVQFTVTFQGELYLDRYVDEAIFDSTTDDTARGRACERVILQVQRSLDFVGRTLPFIDINRVMLAPMPAGPDLRGQFAENLPIPVEPLDLRTIFDLSRTPDLSREENQADYLVALGAALRFMDRTK
jgi:MSHA biogenesis protein MshI